MESPRIPVSIGLSNSEVVVACDDGTVFTIAEKSTWTELPPIPGSIADQIRRRDKFDAELRKTFPVPQWADIMVGLYRLADGDAATARTQAKTLLAKSKEVGSQYARDSFSLAAEVISREGWPEFVKKAVGANG